MAGGSVGHIAGVVNHLESQLGTGPSCYHFDAYSYNKKKESVAI